MRMAQTALLCVALCGCSFSVPRAPEASVSVPRPANQLVGKKLDAIVAQLGQPTRSQPLDNDQTSYMWQIETPSEPPSRSGGGGLYGDGGSPGYVSEGYSPFCRINVVTASSGVVTEANTEESNGTGNPTGVLRSGNFCQQRLRAKSLSEVRSETKPG
jgi:hypothetical protein